MHETYLRIPSWLKKSLPESDKFKQTQHILEALSLSTICEHGLCPNRWECFERKRATFLILGATCTRHCRFCNVGKGEPSALDLTKPSRIAEAVEQLKLRHVVITSVTRDDLTDGGAQHFSNTITAIRHHVPECTIEVLIPDFGGNKAALEIVLNAKPDVLNHNVETVPRLYQAVRPEAQFQRSLEILKYAAQHSNCLIKSGLMVGLGETHQEVCEVIEQLAQAGCHCVTIGQYMAPSPLHAAVKTYVKPEEFERYADYGRSIGIPMMFCAPTVRSSYHAEEMLSAVDSKRI